MASLPNASEMELRRRKMKKPNELLADPTAVGGRAPGTGGPSYIRPTIAGGVRPESGSGGLDFPTPPPGTVGSSPQRPVAAPQPTDAGMVDRISQPNTRGVQGFVDGLPSDQIGGEIGRAAQDRSIIAQRLGATFQMAQKARQSGDLDTYNRLMDDWQGGLEQRRGIESYGRDLSAARPRSYVTPEKAAADQPQLRQQLIRAKQGMIGQQMDDLNATPTYEAAGNAELPANIRNARFSSPQDQIRQRALVDFASQEPVADANGDMTTPDMIEQRRRAVEMANLRRQAINAPKEAAAAFPGTIDESGMNNRFDEAATRASAAGKRAAGGYATRVSERQNIEQLRRGELDLAGATQKANISQETARATGQDTASQIAKLQARATLSEAQINARNAEATNKQYENRDPQADALMNEPGAEGQKIVSSIKNMMTNRPRAGTDDLNSVLADRETIRSLVSRISALDPQTQAAYKDKIKRELGVTSPDQIAAPYVLDYLTRLVNAVIPTEGTSGYIRARQEIQSTLDELKAFLFTS